MTLGELRFCEGQVHVHINMPTRMHNSFRYLKYEKKSIIEYEIKLGQKNSDICPEYRIHIVTENFELTETGFDLKKVGNRMVQLCYDKGKMMNKYTIPVICYLHGNL